jgi:hypothetical protein
MIPVKNLGHAARNPVFLQCLFFVCTALLVAIGGVLAHKAFPKPGPAPYAGVSATVYVQNNPARVWLTSTVNSKASQDVHLSITVKGPKGAIDPWLLVVTCPHAKNKGEVNLNVDGVSEPVPQGVYATVYESSYKSLVLPCYGNSHDEKKKNQTPIVVNGDDINLSLPVLEQSSVAQSAGSETPVYVVRNRSGKQNIQEVLEIVQAPGASCPKPKPNLTTSALPVVSSAPGTSVKGTTSSASPSASSSSPAVAGGTTCLDQISSDSTATLYSVPKSIATSETLSSVNLSGDSIDSIFPPGQITSGDKIIWQGSQGVALSPSLSATNLTSAERVSKDGFIAGLLFGLAGGFFVPVLQGMSGTDGKSGRRKRGRSALVGASSSAETGTVDPITIPPTDAAVPAPSAGPTPAES